MRGEDFANFDVTCRPALAIRCGYALGRCALAHGFCKRRARGKFNSRLKLAFKFKFHPYRSAFKFHNHGRRRLNFAAMQVWH